MIASTTCICYQATHILNGVHVLSMDIDRSWSGFEMKAERQMAEKHAVSRHRYISEHQELMRQVSKGLTIARYLA